MAVEEAVHIESMKQNSANVGDGAVQLGQSHTESIEFHISIK